MDKKLLRVLLIIGVPTLLLAFQNCAKLGTNGIAIDDQTLALEQVAVVDQPSSEVSDEDAVVSNEDEVVQNDNPGEVPHNEPAHNDVPVPVPAPSCGGGSSVIIGDAEQEVTNTNTTVGNSSDVTNTDGVVNSNPEINPNPVVSPQEVTDKDVEDAIRLCKGEEARSAAADNLKLFFNHEVVSMDARNVESIRGNHGVVLLRASQADGEVGEVKVNHSKVVLCGFKSVKRIKGPHNLVIVVGAKISEVDLVHSTLILVNGSAENVKGVQSVVKNYSLK